MATQGKEVVASAHALHFEQLLPDRSQQLLEPPMRRLVRPRRVCTRVGSRQRSPVQLSVCGQRQSFESHVRRRYHVLGQSTQQLLAQNPSIHLLTLPADDIRHQAFLPRLVLPRQHHGRGYGRQPPQLRLDLSQLDPKAADLDLAVAPPETFEHAVGTPSPQVSCPVKPPVRTTGKAVVHEALRRQVWPVEVPARDPYAS